MNFRNRIAHAAFGALLTITAGSSAYADDSEIFVNSAVASLRPNVLFVIDTSGSMDTAVKVRPDYVPATNYAGACTSTAIYWKLKNTSTTPPACASNNNYIDNAPFVCQSARSQLNTVGLSTIGPDAQWNPTAKKWQVLASGVHNNYVECQADAKIDHGIDVKDKLLPANGNNGPFNKNASLGLSNSDWSAFNSYVFYTGNYLNYYELYGSLPTTKSRIQIVKDAAKLIVSSANLDATNVGLMRFSTNAEGGMVIYPMTPVETARSTG